MPTPTYDLIASNVLSSSASSVTFSSIPATYRDLVFVATFKENSSASSDVFLRVNGATTDYSLVKMLGNGSSALSSSLTQSALNINYAGAVTASCIIQALDYSATDKHKTFLIRGDGATNTTQATAARYASTSAISSLTLLWLDSSLFASGSTFYLYGIA